jgi:hypothetical protein
MPFARRSFARRSKALAGFIATPFLRGYDLKRLEKQWSFPAPAAPTFSLDDTAWREEHTRSMAEQPRVRLAPEAPLLRAAS